MTQQQPTESILKPLDIGIDYKASFEEEQKKHKDFLEKLAEKLFCKADESEILGSAENQIELRDALNNKQKEIDRLIETHQREVIEIKKEIKDLKAELYQTYEQSYRMFMTRMTNLDSRIDGQMAVKQSISIMQSIRTWFNKLIQRKGTP